MRWFPAVISAVGAYMNLPVAWGQGFDGPPKVTPTLAASVKAIVPGQPFDLAVQLSVQPGWHIYWSNPGDSGMPPAVKWTLPEGFSAGALRFPVPSVHTTDLGGMKLVTYIHEGKPVLLCTITPPASVAGERVRFEAALDWLVCQEACIPERKTVAIELAVAGSGAAAEPDNEALFRQARAALPATSSSYVTIRTSAPGFAAAPGTKFDLLVEVDIKKGHHIQSDRPLQAELIAARMLLDRTEGLKIGSPQFPAAHEREVPRLGKVSEFSGTVTIKVPCEVRSALTGPVTIGGLLTFQACADSGQCFAPETVTFAWNSSGGAGAVAPTASGADAGTASDATSASVPSANEDPDALSLSASTGDRVASLGTIADAGTIRGLWFYLLFGFAGGMILNVMPCVLPVISIKVLSFVQQSGEDRGRIFRLGLAFCAGVMVWFWAFAGITLFWTPPLQNPTVVIALTTIMFVFGLSLFGVFEINLPGFASQAAGAAAEKEGYAGAFLKGLLATLLGTACTAPLLATALAWASTQPKTNAFAVFTAAGLGMALPYFLLSANPAWMKFLPRPGNWMITFKQLMGFLLVGTAVWLLMTVAAQLGGPGVVQTVSFLTFTAAGCWMIGRIRHGSPVGRQLATWVAALALAGGGAWFSFAYMYSGDVEWRPYRKGLAEELSAQGHTVLVDYTASWCLSCKSNKAVAIEVDSTVKLMNALNVVPIIADYSKEDADMKEDLQKFGRPSVPLVLVYAPGKPDAPEVLPVIFYGPDVVQSALQRAGPSQGASVAANTRQP